MERDWERERDDHRRKIQKKIIEKKRKKPNDKEQKFKFKFKKNKNKNKFKFKKSNKNTKIIISKDKGLSLWKMLLVLFWNEFHIFSQFAAKVSS